MALAEAMRRDLVEAEAAGSGRHDARHVRRIEPIRVDGDVNWSALGDRREDRLDPLRMHALGGDEMRAVRTRGLDLLTARAADRAQSHLRDAGHGGPSACPAQRTRVAAAHAIHVLAPVEVRVDL